MQGVRFAGGCRCLTLRQSDRCAHCIRTVTLHTKILNAMQSWPDTGLNEKKCQIAFISRLRVLNESVPKTRGGGLDDDTHTCIYTYWAMFDDSKNI